MSSSHCLDVFLMVLTVVHLCDEKKMVKSDWNDLYFTFSLSESSEKCIYLYDLHM